MYKMMYKTIKMTKQTINTKTYVQDDIQTIKMTKQTSNTKTYMYKKCTR